MQTPEDVAVMQRLRVLGWGVKRMARERGVSQNTVRRDLGAGGWKPYRQPVRERRLAGLEGGLHEHCHRHRGNAEVVRQAPARGHGVVVSRRTVERAVAGWRQALQAEARATVRFETPPGQPLQVDFGTAPVVIGGERVPGPPFVAPLGYSRRHCVAVFRHERQSAWLEGLERAFQHFDGGPGEVLLDHAKALVVHHDLATRAGVFNERLRACAGYGGFRPRACAPVRVRTTGKDERAVGSVKRKALAGREFASWGALEAHRTGGRRAVADVRVHGTLGERPLERLARAEAAARRPLHGRPPVQSVREVGRRGPSDAWVEVSPHRYSVPGRLIGQAVTVPVTERAGRVVPGAAEVACHRRCMGQRQWRVERVPLAGMGPLVAHRAPCPSRPCLRRSPPSYDRSANPRPG